MSLLKKYSKAMFPPADRGATPSNGPKRDRTLEHIGDTAWRLALDIRLYRQEITREAWSRLNTNEGMIALARNAEVDIQNPGNFTPSQRAARFEIFVASVLLTEGFPAVQKLCKKLVKGIPEDELEKQDENRT